MAGLGASFSKKTPQGRSVEEVILMRKLGESRVQLPAIKTSQSTNSLPVGLGKQDSLPPSTYQPNRLRTAGTKEVLYTESDVRRMMEEVMQYTRALQNRVQVNSCGNCVLGGEAGVVCKGTKYRRGGALCGICNLRFPDVS